MTAPTPAREALAEYAHAAWSGWMHYLFSKCDGSVIPPWAVERWKRQAATAYPDLPEEEKDSDRAEADKILQHFTAFAAARVAEERERCAKVADALAVAAQRPGYAPNKQSAYEEVAAAIRASGKTEAPA